MYSECTQNVLCIWTIVHHIPRMYPIFTQSTHLPQYIQIYGELMYPNTFRYIGYTCTPIYSDIWGAHVPQYIQIYGVHMYPNIFRYMGYKCTPMNLDIRGTHVPQYIQIYGVHVYPIYLNM